MQGENEDEIDELMNNSDKKFIAPKKIELTDNRGNTNILTPESNVYVIDEGIIHTKELEKNKKRKKPEQNVPIAWKRNVSPHSREISLLEGGVLYQFVENASAFNIYE